MTSFPCVRPGRDEEDSPPRYPRLLAPCGITSCYTDKAGVYRRHLPPEQHTVGKLSMQKIERKPLTLRTRLKCLARKTLCFPRSSLMYDLLIGIYRNRVEFGCAHEKG